MTSEESPTSAHFPQNTHPIKFNCTVIKAKLNTGSSSKPNSFVTAKINNREIVRTSIADQTFNPKWNQTYVISCNEDDIIVFYLHDVVDPTSAHPLGEYSMPTSEVQRILGRFHFGLMSRTTLNLKSSVPVTTHQCSYKIFIGLSKIHDERRLANQTRAPQLPSYNTADVSSSILSYEITPDNSGTSNFTIDMLNNPSSVAVEENESELPFGWEARVSESGLEFYVDHNTHNTQWERPNPLPPGWQARRDVNSNRIFFINAASNTVSWQRPNELNVVEHQQQMNIWSERRRTNRQNFDGRYLNNIDGKHEAIFNKKNDDIQLTKMIDSILGPLPPNFSVHTEDKNSWRFFVNHSTKKTSWMDPRLAWLDSDIYPLPPNFSIFFCKYGIPFFTDHIRKLTSFIDPRNNMPLIPTAVIGMKEVGFFDKKMMYFRNICKELSKAGKFKMIILRESLIDYSFSAIMTCPLQYIHRTLFVEFQHEKGLDYGGLSREWIYEISHQILNPQYCLFTTRGCTSDYIFEINPLSHTLPDFKKYFHFVGRIIGLALFNGLYMDCAFSNFFYKKIINQPCGLEDLQDIDIDFYNSIKWISKNNIEESGMELFFCAEIENFGKLEIVEFKPGGTEIMVIEDNKEEYIQLLVDWKLNYGKREQMKFILHGIHEIVPLTWLRCFSVKEFELLLCGIQNYDIKDWKENTVYRGGYHYNSEQILWFWKVVEEASDEYRVKLLQFVTGTSRIPSTGFKDLVGSGGNVKFNIEKWGTVNDLPRSHTCFNRIDLPAYTSYEILEKKLSTAILEASLFLEE